MPRGKKSQPFNVARSSKNGQLLKWLLWLCKRCVSSALNQYVVKTVVWRAARGRGATQSFQTCICLVLFILPAYCCLSVSRHYSSYPWFDRLHHGGSGLCGPAAAQQTGESLHAHTLYVLQRRWYQCVIYFPAGTTVSVLLLYSVKYHLLINQRWLFLRLLCLLHSNQQKTCSICVHWNCPELCPFL